MEEFNSYHPLREEHRDRDNPHSHKPQHVHRHAHICTRTACTTDNKLMHSFEPQRSFYTHIFFYNCVLKLNHQKNKIYTNLHKQTLNDKILQSALVAGIVLQGVRCPQRLTLKLSVCISKTKGHCALRRKKGKKTGLRGCFLLLCLWQTWTAATLLTHRLVGLSCLASSNN